MAVTAPRWPLLTSLTRMLTARWNSDGSRGTAWTIAVIRPRT